MRLGYCTLSPPLSCGFATGTFTIAAPAEFTVTEIPGRALARRFAVPSPDAGTTYTWSVDGRPLAATGADVVWDAPAPGTYEIAMTATKGGTGRTARRQVTVGYRIDVVDSGGNGLVEELRQESNIQLGTMSLAGTATRRRIEFPISVDGADNGTALGVMSQGEMHALGLAMFLPRACAAESPFRFVVIDDPVQSMDPSKVDGLARVLATIATDRQVIVFTHDPRLPEAVRRLEIDAVTLQVQRAERSVVSVEPVSDPALRYLDDARALACSAEVDAAVRTPVVAELCRSALEYACQRVVWRVRTARGERHASIEETLQHAQKTTTLFALALFDDPDRGGDVLRHLRNAYGGWAVNAYDLSRKAVHGNHSVPDLPGFVRDTRRLAEALR